MAGMTIRRERFVQALVMTGNPADAARKAGYSAPDVKGCELSRDPRIREAVRQERARLVDVQLGGLGYACLVDLLTHPERTPPSVRFAAAKFAMELSGFELTSAVDPGKALADMSLAELAELVRAGEKTLTALNERSIDGQAQRLQPNNDQDGRRESLEVAELLG